MESDLLTTARVLARGNPWAFQVWLDGLSPEETRALWVQAGFDAVHSAIEKMIEAIKPLVEAIRAAARAIFEAISGVVESLRRFVPFRRLALYLALRHWRVPDRLAGWTAVRWPARWLPGPCGP